MNASYEWLRELAGFDLTPEQVRDLLTAHVATVEELESVRADLRDIVVARVVERAAHPDSDHLSVTKVDAGTGELLDVVCGAPNVAAGGVYPFAPVGSTLPGGLRIERRRIRGASSNGMLCSARELGLGDDHAGLLTLESTAAPGTPFLDAYRAGDSRLVVDVLPNRPDLLSHEGLARELAALTGRDFATPDAVSDETAMASSTNGVSVEIDARADCSLYLATVIRDVRVAPSPEWLVRKLEAVGVRSINNIVDVTNYMLHGYGQPMHAFDLSKLDGSRIVVRRARDGESITTLDGATRKLDDSMTVIADASSAQAIAGVIGGQGSEVTDATTDILLEVAVFDPKSVRRTRKTLGISTDASYRFERPIDARATPRLSRMAADLIVKLAGGSAADTLMAGEMPPPPAAVTLRVSRVARILGDAIPAETCASYLRRIGFDVTVLGDALSVQPPSWRSDVVLEADLLEEIARLHGYDAFSDELRPFRVGSAIDAPDYTLASRIRDLLVREGLLETRPIPFVATGGDATVRVVNPLAESEAFLREDLLATMSRRVEHNFTRMTRSVRLFEIGTAFRRTTVERPDESLRVAVALGGDRHPAHFADPKPAACDRWDAKWIAERIATAAFGGLARVVPADGFDGWTVATDRATVGRVVRLELDAPVWAPEVWGVEIDLTSAIGAATSPPRHVALPTQPAVELDLALLVPDGVRADAIAATVRETGGDVLESVVPFDEFRGAGVPDGYRSVGWRLTFRHPERTLRDKEIDGRRARIVRALEQEHGVKPRGS